MPAGWADDDARVIEGPPSPRHVPAELEAVLREHHGALLRTARRLCHDADAGEDLLADVYARAWPTLAGGGIEQPLAYLARCLSNGASSSYRRRRVARAVEESARPDRPGGEDEFRVVEERAALAELLAALDPPHRRVLAARYLADLSEADSARLLGVPVGTVKSRLSRALLAARRAAGLAGEERGRR